MISLPPGPAEQVLIDSLIPSPENDEIYGAIDTSDTPPNCSYLEKNRDKLSSPQMKELDGRTRTQIGYLVQVNL
jgi:hypothetical protein